jgi:ligand-binding SRPBCC domain-containing protein
MKTHKILTSMHLPMKIEDVFTFFYEAINLQRITPPELDFRILTPLPIEIGLGTTIDYQLRLFGIPFRWRSEITVWNPPYEFVDMQVSGPYKLWEHTHKFFRDNEGTIIEDSIKYRLPFWPFGEMAYPLVKTQLKRIFRYRQQTIRHLLLKDAPQNEIL